MSNPQNPFGQQPPQNPGQPPVWGGQPQQPQGQPAWGGPQQPQQPQPQPQWAGQNGQPQQPQYGQPQYPQPPQGGYGFQSGPTPPNGGPNKKLLIGGIIGGAVALLLIIILVVALVVVPKPKPVNDNPTGQGTTQEDPGTGTDPSEEPAEEPTSGNWTGDDALYQQTLDILDSPYTLDEAKQISFETCDSLASNPSPEEFGNVLLGGTTDPQVAYDRGAAAGAGVVVYCPEYEDLMYELADQL